MSRTNKEIGRILPSRRACQIRLEVVSLMRAWIIFFFMPPFFGRCFACFCDDLIHVTWFHQIIKGALFPLSAFEIFRARISKRSLNVSINSISSSTSNTFAMLMAKHPYNFYSRYFRPERAYAQSFN